MRTGIVPRLSRAARVRHESSTRGFSRGDVRRNGLPFEVCGIDAIGALACGTGVSRDVIRRRRITVDPTAHSARHGHHARTIAHVRTAGAVALEGMSAAPCPTPTEDLLRGQSDTGPVPFTERL